MQPSVLLPHELVKKRIPKAKIAFALCRVGGSDREISEARHYMAEAEYKVLSGSIPEKFAYPRASDSGRALTETRFPSLNTRTDELAQSIVNHSLMAKVPRLAAKASLLRPEAQWEIWTSLNLRLSCLSISRCLALSQGAWLFPPRLPPRGGVRTWSSSSTSA
jgi:hypothetical protein